MGGPGVSGDTKLALGAMGAGPSHSFGMGLGAQSGRQMESSSWSHNAEGALELRVTRVWRQPARTRGGRGGENQSQNRWVMGASCGWEGPEEQGEKLNAGFGGFQTPGVPSPLLLPWGWVLQSASRQSPALSLHPGPPGCVPPFFLPALERPPPASLF